MKNLFRAVERLTLWQKLAVGLLLCIIVATWLAVCFILGSYVIT